MATAERDGFSRRALLVAAGALPALAAAPASASTAGKRRQRRCRWPVCVAAQFGAGAQPWGVALTGAGEVVASYQGFASDDPKLVATFRRKPKGGFQMVDLFGGLGDGPGQFASVAGVATLGQRLFVVDTDACRVQVFDRSAGGKRPGWDSVTTFGERGTGDDQFRQPAGIVVRPGDGAVLVSDQFYNAGRISVFLPDGPDGYRFDRTIGSEGGGDGKFSAPTGLALDGTGRLYVADSNNDRVQVLAPDGGGYAYLAKFGGSGSGDGEFRTPSGVAVDDRGRVLVTDFGNNRVQLFVPVLPPSPTTGPLPPLWEFAAALGNRQGDNRRRFTGPRMAAWGDGAFVVADTGNNRLKRLTLGIGD